MRDIHINDPCEYCGIPTELVSGRDIYPHRKDLWPKLFRSCAECEAYVGCHDKTGQPLGRVADKTLRRWKQIAHQHFDPLWKSDLMTRTQAYNWLADKMELPVDECHIGMFNVTQCHKVMALVNEEKKQYDKYR